MAIALRDLVEVAAARALDENTLARQRRTLDRTPGEAGMSDVDVPTAALAER